MNSILLPALVVAVHARIAGTSAGRQIPVSTEAVEGHIIAREAIEAFGATIPTGLVALPRLALRCALPPLTGAGEYHGSGGAT